MNNIPGSLTDNHFLLTKGKPQYLSDTIVFISIMLLTTEGCGMQGQILRRWKEKNFLVKIRVVRKKLCLLKDPGKGLLEKSGCTYYHQGFRIQSHLLIKSLLFIFKRKAILWLSESPACETTGGQIKTGFHPPAFPTLQLQCFNTIDVPTPCENWNAVDLCFQNKQEFNFPAFPVFSRFIPGAWF